MKFGGVANNVARQLQRLGAEVTLVGAIGDDIAGRALLDDLKSATINSALIKQSLPTGSYLAIENEKGELVQAVSDLRALGNLDPAVLTETIALKPADAALLLDSNLSVAQMVAVLNANAGGFVAVEAVSVTKVMRLSGLLDRVDALFCNLDEARALLADITLSSPQAAEQLALLGPQYISITNGAGNAVLLAKEKLIEKMPNRANVKTTNGAGDCYTAAVLYHLLSNADPQSAMDAGLGAAFQRLESRR